ncbi:hypothetical protein [Helicobacter suis]|uniref:hypothetical protein n=1 Tax=Helicobacter suis TaxID=104628 RepID=UPI000CF044E0|nr:hypothetical protein [Helicobacter suis]
MYPDISAGRGGLALFNESLNNLRGAHANMANAMQNFSAQLQGAANSTHSILENEEQKALKQKVLDHNQRMDLAMQGFRENQAQAAQDYQQQVFKHSQAMDRVNNAFKTSQLKISQAQSRANIAASNAATTAQNIQNFIQGAVIGTGGSAQHTKAAQVAQRALLGNFKPPNLQKPMIKTKMTTPPLTPPNTPTTAQLNPFTRP